jgi:methanogenic corrinoid protein MtbC1
METGPIKTLSPRDLADAVGVSQSSIKRWVDAGLIPVSRTAGGHRRIAVTAAIRFVREKKMRVVRPELLGMADVTRVLGKPAEELDSRTLHGLLAQHRVQDARSAVLGWFLSGHPMSKILDGPITGALAEFGRQWKEHADGIYREHLATSAIIEIVAQLRASLPELPVYAPTALGGAPENDQYIIPSQMVSCIFREAGYHDINLGANTPVASFAGAVEKTAPEVVWLAVKAPVQSAPRAREICGLAADLLGRNIEVIVGGDGARRLAGLPAETHVIDNMEELALHLATREAGKQRR